LQGKFESGLMTANMVTVRDLVQNIAGINHEAEKRYCLDRVNEIDGATKEEHIRIDTERGTLADIPSLEQNKLASENIRTDLQQKLEIVKSSVSVAESAYAQIKSRFDHDKENRDRRTVLGGKIFETQCNIDDKKKSVESLLATAGHVSELQNKLSADDVLKSAYNAALEERSVVDKRNADAQTEYQKTKTAMSEIMAEVDRKKAIARELYNANHNHWIQSKHIDEYNKQKIESLNQRIKDLDHPCPNCGYIDPMTENLIEATKKQIDEIIIIGIPPEPQYTDPDLSELRTKYAQLMKIPEPTPEVYTMPSRGMSDEEIRAHKLAIEIAQKNQTEAETVRSTVLPSLEKQLADYKIELKDCQKECRDAQYSKETYRQLYVEQLEKKSDKGELETYKTLTYLFGGLIFIIALFGG